MNKLAFQRGGQLTLTHYPGLQIPSTVDQPKHKQSFASKAKIRQTTFEALLTILWSKMLDFVGEKTLVLVLLTNPTLIVLEIVFRTARMTVVEYTNQSMLNQSKYSQTVKFFNIKWVAKVKFQKIGKNRKILKVHTQVKLTNNLHQNLSIIRQCCRLDDSKTILLTRLLFDKPCGKLASAFL